LGLETLEDRYLPAPLAVVPIAMAVPPFPAPSSLVLSSGGNGVVQPVVQALPAQTDALFHALMTLGGRRREEMPLFSLSGGNGGSRHGLVQDSSTAATSEVQDDPDGEDYRDELWSLGHPVGPTQETEVMLVQAAEAIVAAE
jgi:hypothetical protein